MKRLIVLAAAALMAFPAMAQMQEAYPSYIQVNGRAEKEITPDEFYLQVVINERDSKGRISVESQQRDMIAALRKLGVDVEKQLKVANLSSEFFKKNIRCRHRRSCGFRSNLKPCGWLSAHLDWKQVRRILRSCSS